MSDWKSYKMPFGKYRDTGDNMYTIYLNNFGYIKWLDSCQLDKETRMAVDAAIEHKNRTDPYSR